MAPAVIKRDAAPVGMIPADVLILSIKPTNEKLSRWFVIGPVSPFYGFFIMEQGGGERKKKL